MQTSTIRRLALGAALTGGAVVFGLSMTDGAAHADDKPAAVSEHPGGVVGAVEDAVEVVDQLPAPEPTEAPTEPVEDEPTEDEPAGEPLDAPADEPEQAPDEPTADEPVADVPAVEAPVEVPPVVVEPPPVVDVPPVAVDVPPVVIETPPVVVAPVTPPAANPVPTQPDTTAPAPVDGPVAEVLPPTPPVAVVALPVVGPVAGPVAGTGTLLPSLAPAPASTPQPARPPLCTGDTSPAATPDHGRGVVRTITDRRTGLPAAAQQPAPLKPCPTPVGPGTQVDVYAATPPPAHAAHDLAGALTATITWPALDRLTQLRPRGDLPAGRTEHPEPGPA